MAAVDPYLPNDPGQTIVRIGADIGQKQDPTAIIVTEEVKRQDVSHYLVRSLERLPLGTSYPDVTTRIVQIDRTLAQRLDRYRRRGIPAPFTTELIVDATGVGLPVIDPLREQGLWATAALFTGSDRLTAHLGNTITIGKSYMVSRLQMLIQSRRLRFSRSPEAIALTKELQDYQISVSDRGHASFNAHSGTHDYLVIALGLSVGMERNAAPATSRDYRHRDPTREQWAAQRNAVRKRLAERRGE